MSNDKEKEFLDEMLEASLRRYSEVEPRPALEARLLASVPQRARRSVWLWWAGVPAAATALILLAALAFYATRQSSVPPPPAVAQQSPAPGAAAPAVIEPAPPTTPVPTLPSSRHSARAERASKVPPRLARFPAPAPLSEQEQLLLAYVEAVQPEKLIHPWRERQPIVPLEIEPLEIAPLKVSAPLNSGESEL